MNRINHHEVLGSLYLFALGIGHCLCSYFYCFTPQSTTSLFLFDIIGSPIPSWWRCRHYGFRWRSRICLRGWIHGTRIRCRHLWWYVQKMTSHNQSLNTTEPFLTNYPMYVRDDYFSQGLQSRRRFLRTPICQSTQRRKSLLHQMRRVRSKVRHGLGTICPKESWNHWILDQ